MFSVLGSIYINSDAAHNLHKYVPSDIGLLALIRSPLLIFVSSHPDFLGAVRICL